MRRRTFLKAGIITACVLALLILALILLRNADRERYRETRGEMSDGFGQLQTVEWKGSTWREKPAVTTILVAGIDKTDDSRETVSNEYRNGGQADFLLLVAIDHTDKKIHQLQIDRDTMADVTTLGIFGNETGTKSMQICLAHAYGKTPKDNARNTIRAVQNLLEGIQVDGYYIVDYSSVPVLNDTLGGVTVKIPTDMTAVNPAWTAGKQVTLRGAEAETFVRTRKALGDEDNINRMARQNEFMQQAIRQMARKVSEDVSFAGTLVENLRKLAVTNLTAAQMEEDLGKAYSYEVLSVDHPDGEHSFGRDGFMEFHMQEGAAVEWVLEHLYERQ